MKFDCGLIDNHAFVEHCRSRGFFLKSDSNISPSIIFLKSIQASGVFIISFLNRGIWMKQRLHNNDIQQEEMLSFY